MYLAKIKNLFLLVVISFLLSSPLSFSQIPVLTKSSDEEINIMIYKKITPSIVSIDAKVKDGISSGTGCVIEKGGVILTSSHVVLGASEIEVITNDNNTYKASLISTVGEHDDLALIKIKPKKTLKSVKMGDSEKLEVGQRVLAIGNPFGFNGTLTTGIISRIDKKRNKIQTDAAINPGSSGGPLLNTKGEVIGINQSIYNPDNNKSNIGIGFAIPSNLIKTFIANAKIR